MPTFLFLEKFCINLDTVTSVDLNESANGEGYCTVWFSGGGKRDFHGEDYRKLLDFLKKQKVA